MITPLANSTPLLIIPLLVDKLSFDVFKAATSTPSTVPDAVMFPVTSTLLPVDISPDIRCVSVQENGDVKVSWQHISTAPPSTVYSLYHANNANGPFRITDATNSQSRFSVDTNGHCNVALNLRIPNDTGKIQLGGLHE